MNILFLTGRETSYPRNALLLKIFRTFADVQVIPATENPRNIIGRSISLTYNLWTRNDLQSFDLIFVGFYGHLLMLSLPNKKLPPILFDAFVSTYDTLIEDRQLTGQQSLLAELSKWMDRAAVKKASHVLLDTYSNILFYQELVPKSDASFSRVFASCDTDLFFPRPDIPVNDKLVLFYGTFLPIHGVDTIIRAAHLLKGEKNILFKLIGIGKESKNAIRLINNLELDNVEIIPPVPISILPEEIAKASICLCGHFGKSKKAARVIASKTFQCLAMAKPIIVGDNSANKELLIPGHDAIFCKMNSPDSLAEAIRSLFIDKELKKKISQNGLTTFNRKAGFPILQSEIQDRVLKILK